jgi:transposase-like protein
MIQCNHCGSNNVKKNGSGKWGQRYYCKNCGRTFTLNKPRFDQKTKFMAIQFYLNNVGIRKIALFLKTSPTSILRWIRNAHKILQKELQDFDPMKTSKTDIIEMDEIYTYVKKRIKGPSYGLLTLEGESVLLHIPSEKE